MELNVEEASRKICPMSFSVYVLEDSDYKESVYSMCKSEKCMAWSWTKEEEKKGYCKFIINKIG